VQKHFERLFPSVRDEQQAAIVRTAQALLDAKQDDRPRDVLDDLERDLRRELQDMVPAVAAAVVAKRGRAVGLAKPHERDVVATEAFEWSLKRLINEQDRQKRLATKKRRLNAQPVAPAAQH